MSDCFSPPFAASAWREATWTSGSRWFLCWLRTSHEPLRLGGLEKLRNWRISPGKPIGVQKTGQILGKPICLKPLVISE